MLNPLLQVVQEQKKENPVGVYSVCSANKYVLKASMLQAKKDNSGLLVEPTVNQVNQFGGYTGMQPGDFVKYLRELAAEVDYPAEKLILGGDHLGPNPWKNESAESAMEKSRTLVEQYVAAGYTKIHLDTSIPCADDDVPPHTPMDDEVVAKRATELCHIAEETYTFAEDYPGKPVYIIGTEVPIPGGAEGSLHDLEVTGVEAAQKTLEVTKEAFYSHGLEDAWNRVIAQVVQPGVEFGNDSVVEYDPEKADTLSTFIEQYDDKIFEAHSTDYQSVEGLSNLVRDHFAILKVGPWLTFAFREAIFGLSYIEKELLGNDKSV
ncbi:MAG: class II D-tagatose-bisphosphate aldolase, non-catalytic subunit, partial [Candidatus Marinimicrobia bacterium]|nr:class II D-tagatose-bisphosphate aldolase, non-catalytic subunit [Candidatus Neomarinimicrobiota bacterium]